MYITSAPGEKSGVKFISYQPAGSPMNLTNILVIALVCASIGYIAGLMISNMRRDSEPPKRRAADHILQDDPSYLGVARLARDTINGPLLIEMDGRYYRTPGEMNPEMRARMEEITLELHGWLGYPLAPARAGEEMEPAMQMPVAELEPVEPEAVEEVEPAVVPVLTAVPAAMPVDTAEEELPPAVPAVLPPAPPAPPVREPVSEPVRQAVKTGPLPGGQAAPQPARKKAPLSIVEQIDDILQVNMAGTEYSDKGIRLFETPNRGVAVRVGLDQFQLDEVPDPAIRAMIRAAVSEWELQAK